MLLLLRKPHVLFQPTFLNRHSRSPFCAVCRSGVRLYPCFFIRTLLIVDPSTSDVKIEEQIPSYILHGSFLTSAGWLDHHKWHLASCVTSTCFLNETTVKQLLESPWSPPPPYCTHGNRSLRPCGNRPSDSQTVRNKQCFKLTRYI